MPGLVEIALILVIILILLGPRRLGDAGRGIGEMVRNIRRGVREDEDGHPPD